MLERVRRMKNTLGLPRLKFSHPDAFFDGLNAEAGDKLLTVRPRTAVGSPILPKLTAPANLASWNTQQWVGELYLELHRGTYTSQAFVKAGNRHMEARLRETEALCLLALVHGGSGYQYGRVPDPLVLRACLMPMSPVPQQIPTRGAPAAVASAPLVRPCVLARGVATHTARFDDGLTWRGRLRGGPSDQDAVPRRHPRLVDRARVQGRGRAPRRLGRVDAQAAGRCVGARPTPRRYGALSAEAGSVGRSPCG